MTQMRSKRAIWWRSENPAACREFTLGKSFAIAAIALLAVPIWIVAIYILVAKLAIIPGWGDSQISADIAAVIGMYLIVPLVFVWINIPVVVLYLYLAIPRGWTGIFPTLFTGLVYGLIWGGFTFWAMLNESNPSVLSGGGFSTIGGMGVVNAGLVWLVTRGMFPQAYRL